LTRQKGETDYVLSNVLDGLIGDGSWRAGPAYESYLNKPGVDRDVNVSLPPSGKWRHINK
ncbi:hypothetical protein MJM04_30810, partial [Salmonella enterica subsp. enterica serovar Cerro]|nr:hypothetical protein [Salmonella enterica subsp. enterica serovar Cerro]